MTIANLTLNAKTYTFTEYLAGVIAWYESSAGVPSGYGKADISVRQPAPSQANGVIRVLGTLKMPVISTGDEECCSVPAGTVMRVWEADVVVRRPRLGTAAEGTDFGTRLDDFVSTAMFKACVTTGLPPA